MCKRRHELMDKGMFNLTAKELIEFELMGGETGSTSDLTTALSDALTKSNRYLELCLAQIAEYSDNEWVLGGRDSATITEMQRHLK